jgi:hypothetical protein
LLSSLRGRIISLGRMVASCKRTLFLKGSKDVSIGNRDVSKKSAGGKSRMS